MSRNRVTARALGRLGRSAFLGFLLSATVWAAQGQQSVRRAPAACPDAPSEFADVADVRTDLSLALVDGRVVRLPGLEPPRATAAAPERPDALRTALERELAGRTVGLAPLGPAGRWGTVPAIVFTENGPLADILLANGAVRFRPDPDARPCRGDLLAAENGARRAGLGVWSDPALRAADGSGEDFATTSAGLDGMVLVEGTVASVGETATRLFLNFGKGRGGFAISLPKRDTALISSDAVVRARAIGTRLRVRGLVDRYPDPRIDLFDADALEILEPADETRPRTRP